MINVLAFVGAAFLIFLTVIVIIFAYKSKPTKNIYKLSSSEKEKFLSDSIAIQRNNSAVIKNQTFDEVIDSGFAIMVKEEYKMLNGVDQNGI